MLGKTLVCLVSTFDIVQFTGTQAIVTTNSLNTDECSKAHLFDNKTRDNSPVNEVFCSLFDSRPWVQVDLGRETYVRQVILHPRKGHEDRLNNVYVRVGSKSEEGTPLGRYASKNVVCGRYSGVQKVDTPREFLCNSPLKGRYITIQRFIVGHLDMSEIEIDADPYGIIPETYVSFSNPYLLPKMSKWTNMLPSSYFIISKSFICFVLGVTPTNAKSWI